MTTQQAETLIEQNQAIIQLLEQLVTYSVTTCLGIALCWSAIAFKQFLYSRNARNII